MNFWQWEVCVWGALLPETGFPPSKKNFNCFPFYVDVLKKYLKWKSSYGQNIPCLNNFSFNYSCISFYAYMFKSCLACGFLTFF